ncbi:MAG: FHA domain-containing protein [Myxococcales bacterium]|nr:FHA domain-containing protein [Myxococcales bacterium]MCB9749444.1 FHA domain-containing protein [Myxococcales bacterium]
MSVKLTLGTSTAELGPQNPRVLLGRDETKCELWVHDNSVSRRHAEIYLQGGQTYIRDLGSSNGVWVDNNPYDEIPPVRVGMEPIAIQPHWKVWVGHAPVGVEWVNEAQQGATVMVAAPPNVREMIAAARAQMEQQTASPAPAPAAPSFAPSGSPAAHAQAQAAGSTSGGSLGVGGTVAPSAAELTYRRQGSNNNGTLLIALPQDTFNNEDMIRGYLEFTATDRERVASIFIELIERHKKGPRGGHVWDRCLVRQGPWRTKKDDILSMPFELRVPSGPSITGPMCHWELRGYVDIAWALDIEAVCPINMRNTDIEKIRDALGALDYRVGNLDSKPLGQKFVGKFNPPAHLQKQLNITDVNLDIEYLGTNLKITMVVEKSRLFHFDKKQEFVFDIAKLRAASRDEVSQHFQTEINRLMNK